MGRRRRGARPCRALHLDGDPGRPFLVLAANAPALLDKPLLAGLAFGLITYVIMNLIIVPLRWPAAFPPKPLGIATQLFAHLILVALPTVLIARMLAKVAAAGAAPAA